MTRGIEGFFVKSMEKARQGPCESPWGWGKGIYCGAAGGALNMILVLTSRHFSYMLNASEISLFKSHFGQFLPENSQGTK